MARNNTQADIKSLIESFEVFYKRYYWDFLVDLSCSYPQKKSLEINFVDLDNYDSNLAEMFLTSPDDILEAANIALCDIDLPSGVILHEAHARFVNTPSKRKIRALRSEDTGRFITIEGLVVKTTEVGERIAIATYECPFCHHFFQIKQARLALEEPYECPQEDGGCGRKSNRFLLRDDKTSHLDAQKIRIQESPEELRGGEMPYGLDIYLEDDLVGKVYPGDRVVVSGVIRRYLRTKGNIKTPYYERYFEANSLELKQEAFDELDITESDIRQIHELSKVAGIYGQFVKSFAPTIYGHEKIKEAIVLQMFGGYAKRMPDGITVLRGDIHILLVGDPGTAKSVMLKYAKGLAPRSIYVSGKGSSEAGLTAAAVKDDFGEGRWTLEAGAMVMADKGLACVDEIDKMREETRDALHEALEQQTVSIAKAGINAQLNARASLLAAANPVMGRFSIYDPLAKQINMKPTLLSRFDLIFTFYDKPEEETDSKMAEYILNNSLSGELIQCAAAGVHLDRVSKDCMDAGIELLIPPIEKDLMRKYIAWSRQKVFPVMTKEARAIFLEFFKKIRKTAYDDENAPIPITARQLDALVRLGEASARTRLSTEVTVDDAKQVVALVEHCLNTVFVDPESGKLDVDWVDGTAKTKQNIVRSVTNTIRVLNREYGEEVPVVEIVEAASFDGYTEADVDDAIQIMLRDGLLYRPGNGVVRLVK